MTRHLVSKIGPVLWLAPVVLLSAVVFSACDSGESVRVENHTAEHVTVYEDDAVVGTLEPGQHDEFGILPFDDQITYSVKAADGRMLAERSFTWDEIDDEGGITIIAETSGP